MTELVIAVLMTAVVTYGVSAASKLRSGQAYRAFRAGLAATALISHRLTGPAAAVLVTAEAVVTGLCAAALLMTFLSGAPAPVLTGVALAGAAALMAVLTAGVAVAVRRGVTAPCACFGSGGRAPLGVVHLARNAFLLVVLVAGVAGAGLQRWQPGLAAAVLAASAGGVSALLLTRLDDVAALFRTAR
jgi:hypothetical protein